MVAASYAGIICWPMASPSEYAKGADRRTDKRRTVRLRFPLDVAGVIIWYTNPSYSLLYNILYKSTVTL